VGAEVTVAAGTHVSVYRLFNFGAPVAVTGPEGTFQFPNQPAESTVLVRSAKGYALTTAAQLAAAPDVAVRPWGRIEGVLRAGDRPLANETLGINRWGSGDLYDWSQVSHTTTAATDALGRFVFPWVATCTCLSRNRPMTGPPSKSATSTPSRGDCSYRNWTSVLGYLRSSNISAPAPAVWAMGSA
jgi:hypothetical protein